MIRCTIKHGSILGDIIILSALFSYIRTYKEFKWSALLGVLSSIFALSFFLMLFVMVFGYPSVMNVQFPFHQLSSMIRIGRFLENLEAFYFGFWIVASVVRFSIYLYMTAFVFSRTLNIKESEPLLLPFAALIIMLGMIPSNIIEIAFKFRDRMLLEYSMPVFLGLPIILWIVSKVRGSDCI